MTDESGVTIVVTEATEKQRSLQKAINKSQPQFPGQGELVDIKIEGRVPDLSIDAKSDNMEFQLLSMEQAYLKLETLTQSLKDGHLADFLDDVYIALKGVRDYLEGHIDYKATSPFEAERQRIEAEEWEAKEIAKAIQKQEDIEVEAAKQVEALDEGD